MTISTHYSDYEGGNYYRFDSSTGESFVLKRNFDAVEGEWFEASSRNTRFCSTSTVPVGPRTSRSGSKGAVPCSRCSVERLRVVAADPKPPRAMRFQSDSPSAPRPGRFHEGDGR